MKIFFLGEFLRSALNFKIDSKYNYKQIIRNFFRNIILVNHKII